VGLEGLHTTIHLTRRTSSESTATIITSRVSLNTAIYIPKKSSDMAQNKNIVVYVLLPVGGAQQPPPACPTYHLPPLPVIGEYSPQHADRQSISAQKLAMGVPHHSIHMPPPEDVCWRHAVKDQMLVTGYI